MLPKITNQLVPFGLLFVGFGLGLLCSKTKRWRDGKSIILSPLQSQLSHLSASQLAELPYPPNALPGARDVTTPYGHLRVYEWGPEHGRKVLFVHGISTPSVALGAMVKLEATVPEILTVISWSSTWSCSSRLSCHPVRSVG